MGRMLTLAVFAANLWVTTADTYTYDNLVLCPYCVEKLRTVFNDATAKVQFGKLSYTKVDSNVTHHPFVLLVPSELNKSTSLVCNLNRINPTADGIKVFNADGKIAGVPFSLSGFHDLMIASCSPGRVAVSVVISGKGLGAHEHGWSIVYAISALFCLYLMLVTVWRIFKKGEVVNAHTKQYFVALGFSLIATVAGCLHYLPEDKNTAISKEWYLFAEALATTWLMFTLVVASASVASAGRDRLVETFCWIIFFTGNLAPRTANVFYHECLDQASICQDVTSNVLLFYVGIGVFLCACVGSFGACRQDQQQKKTKWSRRLVITIGIYVTLSTIRGVGWIYDVPSGSPSWLPLHYLAGVALGQISQCFGLLACLWLFFLSDLRLSNETGEKYEHVDSLDSEVVPGKAATEASTYGCTEVAQV